MKEVKEGKSHLLDRVPFEIEVLVARGEKERDDGGREEGREVTFLVSHFGI